MTRPDRDQLEAAVAHLQRMADANHGRFPTSIVEAHAAQLGVSPRTMWRYLKIGLPAPVQSKLQLTTSQLEAIAGANGNCELAWQQLVRDGEYDKSYRQFMRSVNALPPIERTGLLRGVVAGLQKGLFLQSRDEHRLDRVIFDHTEADIRIQRMYAGKLEMFRPWVSLLLDASSRMILAAIITEGDGIKGDPNTESLVALMASSIRGHHAADGTFVGGRPRLVQCDNAKAHLADAMLSGFITLGISSFLIKPGTPWEDGKVERLMHTFNEEFLKSLPGYTAATPDRYGHAAWVPADCLTIEEFTIRFEQWIDRYNYERVHSSLGCTPFAQWSADDTLIEQVDDALIRGAFLANSRPRSVDKNGVMFRKTYYIHKALQNIRGKKVTLRFLPNDRSFVDVYVDGAFVCTAVPHARLTQDERITIVRERTREGRKVDRIIKQSRQRRKQREWSGNPFLGPERDISQPAASIDVTVDEDELLLQRAEELAKEQQARATDEEGNQQ